MVQRWDCMVDGARFGFLSFKILSSSPCFVGTGIVLETGVVLGGGHWALAADLLDNLGKTVSA